MEPIDITKKIEAYLSQTLTVEEMQTFEKEIANNPKLAHEVKIQQDIQEAAKRAGMRSEIKKVAKSYHFYKNSATLGIIVAVLGIASLIGYFILKNGINDKQKTEKINPSLLEQLASKAPIDNLKSDFYTWNGTDSVIITKQGVLVSIPKDALLLNGKPYNQPAIIQWQEAMDAATIVKSGLSTTSNGKLLETQGMFGIEAYTKDGKKLTVNPKVGIYVQVPVDQYKKGMMLFKGEKDTAGMINWVNPKPLYKIPVSVDMKDLNFYPKGYEDTLNALKLPQGRKYRDSLYASLEEGKSITDIKIKNIDVFGRGPIKVVGKIKRYGKQFPQDQYPLNNNFNSIPIEKFNEWKWELKKINKDTFLLSVQQNTIKKNDKTGIEIPYNNKQLFLRHLESKINVLDFELQSNNNMQSIGEIQKNRTNELRYWAFLPTMHIGGILIDNFKYDNNFLTNINQNSMFDRNWKDSLKIVYTWKEVATTYSKKIIIRNDNIKKIDLNVTLPIYDNQEFKVSLSLDLKTKNSNSIPPSKVLAFWNKKFNNTNLSTREFEARMKEIHTTCNGEILALYVNNLNKNISDIDQQVANMGYPAFEEFAKEQVGAVNPNNPHLNNLMKFYEKTADEISKKAAQLIAKQAMREKELDNELAQARSKETVRTIQRNAKALKEEYELNLTNVYEQLEIEKPVYRQITNKTIGITIINPGAYNIDKYVMDATVARSSADIIDPKTGKTAKITYNDFSFQVKDANKCQKLFAYLFPNKLNSYQRINGSAGNFDYPLNDDLVYHLAIVGMNEDGFFYYEQRNIKQGKLGIISLEKMTEKELDRRIEELNVSRGIVKPMNINDELGWLVKEQQYYVETKRRMEHDRFIRRMKKIVFPCYKEDEYDSAEEPEEIPMK